MKKLKDFFWGKREGAGGILFLFCSGMCAFAMVITIGLIRDSTARAVAENTEHTIALHCLASCYTNNEPTSEWRYDKGFQGIASDTTFYPLEKFNEIMLEYRLMDPNYQSTDIYLAYDSASDSEHPTFTIQCSPFAVHDNRVLGEPSMVYPEPQQVVIENN